MFIRDYMHTDVITVTGDTLIHDAEKLMKDNGVRRLPVVDKGKLVGIVTRDRIREATSSKATSLSVWELHYLLAKTKVKDVMETNLFTVTPDTPVEQAVGKAQERGVGTLLVVVPENPKKLVGIATTTDLYKITTQILGFGQPGMRLEIIKPDGVKSTREILDAINRHGAGIISMYHIAPPARDPEVCIVNLDTQDATLMVAELRSKGYQVEATSR